jgi:hypothetical protein
VRPSDASRLVLDDPRRPSRPRCVFAGLGSWGCRLLARVAPAFDVAAVVGSGRPESVAWSVRNYPDVPYLDTLAKALALPALDAVFLATPTSTHAEDATMRHRVAVRACLPGFDARTRHW